MTTTLSKGSNGPEIRILQEALAKQGQSIKADGQFGPATDLALRNFQRQQGLVSDGIAGPKTQSALGIKVTSHAPKKTPKENLHDILARVGLSPTQAATAMNFRPILTASENPKLMRTSDEGVQFIYSKRTLLGVLEFVETRR